jgi:hypothetical protein
VNIYSVIDNPKVDGPVKGRIFSFDVIPAKAGL